VITGPQAITHAQIADELAAVTGHTVRYVGIPPAVAH
jgi:uncharacterized protein YbjT (DUF2867 family)